MQKLQEAAAQVPEKQIYLIQQRPYDVINDDGEMLVTTTPDQRVRDLYLHGSFKEAAEKLDNVHCVVIHYEIDNTGHPTDSGTQQILQRLHDRELSPNEFIWNSNFILSSKPYQQVEAIYRYGCNSCQKFGTDLKRELHSHQLLCDDCYGLVLLESDKPNPRLADLQNRINGIEAEDQHHNVEEEREAKRFRSENIEGQVPTGDVAMEEGEGE